MIAPLTRQSGIRNEELEMVAQIPAGFVLKDDVIVETTILSIIIIKETRKGFINNSSFLTPHSSFKSIKM